MHYTHTPEFYAQVKHELDKTKWKKFAKDAYHLWLGENPTGIMLYKDGLDYHILWLPTVQGENVSASRSTLSHLQDSTSKEAQEWCMGFIPLLLDRLIRELSEEVNIDQS